MIPRSVQINEILAIGNKGEYNKAFDPSDMAPYKRIILHLNKLIEYTFTCHMHTYTPPSVEKITRLVMNEFSLYTAGKPLTLDEYKMIAAEVAKKAHQLPPNIHFLIATLPVLWPDNTLHNAAFYVQSPTNYSKKKPKLNHFSKRAPFFSKRYSPNLKLVHDLLYKNDRQEFIPLFNLGAPLPHLYTPQEYNNYFTYLENSPFEYNDPNQFYGALRIVTAAHQIFGTSVEICKEHYYSTALYDMIGLVKQSENLNRTSPRLFTQLISSSHISLLGAAIAHKITHVDSQFVNKDDFIGILKHADFEPTSIYAFSHTLRATPHKRLRAVLNNQLYQAVVTDSTRDQDTFGIESMDTYSYPPTATYNPCFFNMNIPTSPPNNTWGARIINDIPSNQPSSNFTGS